MRDFDAPNRYSLKKKKNGVGMRHVSSVGKIQNTRQMFYSKNLWNKMFTMIYKLLELTLYSSVEIIVIVHIIYLYLNILFFFLGE